MTFYAWARCALPTAHYRETQAVLLCNSVKGIVM